MTKLQQTSPTLNETQKQILSGMFAAVNLLFLVGCVFDKPSVGDGFSSLKDTTSQWIQPSQPGQAVIQVGDWKGAVLNTHISYKDDNGYDLNTTLGGIISPSIWIKDAIETYTGHKMTWATGNDAIYKNANDAFSSLDPNANNVGKANEASKEHPEGTSVKHEGAKYFGFTEGGLMSQVANLIPGMNAMAVFHDKLTNSGNMAKSPLLETSIIPSIPTTYMGLLFGGTANDLGLDIKTNNMYQQSTDRMSTTPVPSNLNEYMEQQKNELQQLKDKYTK